MTRNLTRATRVALVALIASTAIIMTAPIASAAGCFIGTAEGDYCYTSAAGESTIVDYIGTSVNLDIPGTLGGLPVTTIGPTAFYMKSLETVTIANSVTTIGENAFRQNSITSVTLPSSLVTLGLAAFHINSLTSVTLPEGTAVIGPYAFAINGITSVTIPSSVTTISPFAFASNSLTSVTFASTTALTTIDNSAFAANVLTTVTMGGDEPASLGTLPFGSVSVANDPLVSFPDGATFTHGVPGIWSANGTNYRVLEPVTVTFVSPKGVAPAPAHPIAYTGAVNPGHIADAGYRFDGWYTAASGGSAVTFPLTVTGDTTFYAHWTRLFMAIFSSPQGTAPLAVFVPNGDPLADPGAIAAAGYRFDGWFDAASGGTAVSFPFTVTAATTIYAHWTSLFNVTYTTAYSLAPTSVVIPDGDTVADPGSLTATGYRFDGWYTAASGGTAITFPLTVTADTTIYAHWTQLFAATFSSPEGTAPSAAVVATGDTLSDPGPLTADIHRFTGWFDAPTGGIPLTFPLTVTADTAIYAQWVARDVVAPADAGAGTSITVTGTGFEPGESVAIELHSDPVLLGTVVANGSGAISGTFTIPASVPAGSHSLVLTGSVTGVSSGGITIGGPLAFTGTNPVPLGLGAVALVGIGLLLRRRNSH